MYMEKTIKFKLNSNVGDIEKLAQKSAAFLKFHGCPDDTIRTQIVILRELIICGKKFGPQNSPEIEMLVQLQIETDSITVEINQPVNESTCGELAELDQTIQRIRGCQDHFVPYLINPAESADASPIEQPDASRLDRLAYKTNAMIDFYVSEDSVLNLSAVRSLKAESINIG